MTDFAVGIDLGTSTSVISVFRNGEPFVVPDPQTKIPIVPSLVSMSTNGEIRVGEAARSRVDVPGYGCREFKREMGRGQTFKLMDRTLTPEELSSFVLLKLKENAEEAIGDNISEVVVSVPANFEDPAKNATLTAGELAKLRVVRMINEPTAAALAFGVKNLDVEEQLVVFDFGGGTLDVSVLEMVNGILDVKCSYGDPQLGGKDFDQLVQDFFLSKFKQQYPTAEISPAALTMLKEHSEKAKKQLSTSRSFDDPLRAFGFAQGQLLDLEVEITRPEFDRLVSPLLGRATEILEKALKAKDVARERVDRILLVGGTTYIPCVRQRVAEFFGKEPRADIQPDLAVAIGASVQAAIAGGLISEDKGIILTDVCPYGLGIDIVTMVGGRPMIVYDPLIPPNTKIPYAVKRDYTLLHQDQDAVTVHVYQDHNGTAKLPIDAKDTGIEARIENIPPSSTGMPHPLEVEFSYDINGLARLRAQITATRQEVEISFQGSDLRMDERQKNLASRRVDELWKKSSRSKQYEGIIEKADKLVDEIDDGRKELLTSAVSYLKQALTRGNQSEMEKAGDRLVDLMYDIETNR